MTASTAPSRPRWATSKSSSGSISTATGSRGRSPPEFGALSSLGWLGLDHNQLSGPIPVELTTLPALQDLYFENNALTGSIPAGLVDRNLRTLYLAGNSGLTGCIPASLRSIRFNELGTLGLSYCTTTTTYLLTTTAGTNGSVSPLPGTYRYLSGASVTVTATPDADYRVAAWGGDCSGTATTCTLTMDAAKTVTATFAALAADRCATVSASDCIRAVYKGAPGDYAQVADIPADKLLTPGSDGRYTVERGQQVTVVTAAPLPTGYTRFYLQRRPPGAPGTPDPVSFSQLIPPVGTTYTFTVTTDEGGRTLFTFDLTAARTRPFARPGHKPELGDRVVTTTFQVATCETGGAVANPATDTALVADCDALLAMRDALAGTATLNWAAGTPISSWEGVTVAGTPQRVTKLSLANSSLTGELPRGLGGLTALTELRLNGNQLTGHVPWALTQLPSLTHLYLAGNSGLTGCIPPALRTITNNDMATLGLPDCAPLALTLTAERAQCTEATLNPVTWTITGGSPPYTVTVDGETAPADATSANATCGTLPDYGIWLPVTEAPGTITATVTDATGAPATASAAYTIVPPLPAPTGVGIDAMRTAFQAVWDRVPAAGSVPTLAQDCPCPLYLLRWRPSGTTSWTTALYADRGSVSQGGTAYYFEGVLEGSTYQWSIATLRDAIEQQTPTALTWSPPVTAATVTPATGVRATATHDTITVRWDPQPTARSLTVSVDGPNAGGSAQLFASADGIPPEAVFRNLPPDTEYLVTVSVPALDQTPRTEITVRTTVAPSDWTPPPRGPQNLRTAVTHNSVTVNWGAPYTGAHDVYTVSLFHANTEVGYAIAYGGVTAHTFTGLTPTTTYKVVVTHIDIVRQSAEASVTTAAEPTETARQTISPVPMCTEYLVGSLVCTTPFEFHWPLVHDDPPPAADATRCTAYATLPGRSGQPAPLDEALRLTSDIWDWRGSRFHGRRRHDLRSDHGRRQDGQRHL